MENISSDLTIRVKASFTRIEALCLELSNRLERSARSHVAYKIPMRDSLNAPKKVIPQPLVGQEAWDIGVEALSKFYRDEKQHPSAPYRLPGILYVDNLDSLLPLIEEINTEKRALKDMFGELDVTKRRRFTVKTLPGVMLLQLYRPIEFYQKPIRRAVFSWVSTSSSSKVSAQEVMTRINREMESLLNEGIFPGENGTTEEWLDILNKDLKRLESYIGQDTLRLYRPVAPHPRLMLFDYTESELIKPVRTYHANIPVLIGGDQEFSLRSLPEFDAMRAHKERKDKKQKTPVIPRYFLFSLEGRAN